MTSDGERHPSEGGGRGGRRRLPAPLGVRRVRDASPASVLLAAAITAAMTAALGLAALDPRGLPAPPRRSAAASLVPAPERIVYVEAPRVAPGEEAPAARPEDLEAPRAARAPARATATAPGSPSGVVSGDTTARAARDTADAGASAGEAARDGRPSLRDLAFPSRECDLACRVSRPPVFGRREVPTSGPERDSVLRVLSAKVPVLGRRGIPRPRGEVDAIYREREGPRVRDGRPQMQAGAVSEVARATGPPGIQVPLPGGGPSREERARNAKIQRSADSLLARIVARARERADSLALAREDSIARADSATAARRGARPPS